VRILSAALLLVFFLPASFAESPVLKILDEELNRNLSILKEKADPPPYFISYEVTDEEFQSVAATLGSVSHKSGSRRRHMDVSLRVGSPKLDNYHRVRGERAQFTSGSQISLDDVPIAIKQSVWLETDRAYREAAERLIKMSRSRLKIHPTIFPWSRPRYTAKYLRRWPYLWMPGRIAYASCRLSSGNSPRSSSPM
jgi:hypothetical protein